MSITSSNPDMTAEWLYSAEVRWFFPLDPPPLPGQPPQPPAAIMAWFQDIRNNLIWPPQSRTDRYLLLPGCTSAGVKLREGRFEVKALSGTAEAVTLAHGVTGLKERWVKWSSDGAAAGLWTAALSRETAGWLDATKWRLQRAFAISKAGIAEISEKEISAATFSTVELTAVQAQKSFWWTLGLEATGALPELDENFKRLSSYFFGQTKPPLILDERHSYAYPSWLNTLTKNANYELI